MSYRKYTDDVRTGVFRDQEDLGNAMADERYGVDPNYTRAVQAKVARSTNTDFASRVVGGAFRSDPRS